MAELWTDERIIAVSEGLGAHFDRDSGDRLLWNQMARMIEKDMRAIRDDLQQRIDALHEECDSLLDLKIENAKLRDDYAGLQSWCKAVEERLQADIDQQKEDMAEIERLRSELPGPEVLRAIRDMADDAVKMSDDYHAGDELDLNAIYYWLYNLAETDWRGLA